MASEYWRRIKNQNFSPAILVINAKPFFFPRAWVTESYSLGSVLQYATKKEDPFILLPSERSIDISIQIPMDQAVHKTYYNIAKQVIRATTLLCTTNKTYKKEDEVKGSEKISIFDGMSWKFPIKKSKSGITGAPIESKSNNFNEKLANAKKSVKNQIELEKTGMANSGNGKKNFQFSKMALPHWMPVACGYFGYSVQALGCILTSFSTSASASESVENWNISLAEYEWKNTEEIDETPVEIADGAETKIEIAPDRKIASAWQESNAKIDLKDIRKKHEEVQSIVKSLNGNS